MKIDIVILYIDGFLEANSINVPGVGRPTRALVIVGKKLRAQNSKVVSVRELHNRFAVWMGRYNLAQLQALRKFHKSFLSYFRITNDHENKRRYVISDVDFDKPLLIKERQL